MFSAEIYFVSETSFFRLFAAAIQVRLTFAPQIFLFMSQLLLTNYFKRFRFIAILEGISYLLLLFIAMPLKYFADMPQAVKYVGWAHGVFFIFFLLALLQVWILKPWKITKVFVAFIASLLPFGTIIMDREWKKEG